MPKLGTEAEQESIGWTLVGEDAEAAAEAWAANPNPEAESEYAVPGGAFVDEKIYEDAHDPIKHAGVEPEPEQEQPQEIEQQPEQQAPEQIAEQASQPLTQDAIREGLQELSTYVADERLNQGESAATFPHEICSSLGTTLQAATAEGFKAEEAITLSSEFTVAGLREFNLCKGDFSKLPQMPDELAFAAGYRWAKAHGYNPQDPNIDLRGIGRMERIGTLSILQTINAGYSDPEQINSPESINWFRMELQKYLGNEKPLSYEHARAYLNAYAKRVYDVASQLYQNQQAQPTRAQRRSGQRVPANMREGIKGSKPSRFKTNSDLYDDSTMQAWAMRRL